ncbi:hypothetical protein MVEN_01402000 [Mycena venus]|uniref:Chromo domain-containing protein n=1 Tax=Mycena venus TaxID=2733690 RepID=A0A8H7CSP9_9AGAR|nr:hypothetical protein MVEN_01402000 [Mycena venus]
MYTSESGSQAVSLQHDIEHLQSPRCSPSRSRDSPSGEPPPSAPTNLPSTPPAARFPFINIDLGDSRPSESAYTNPAERRQFGMPLTGVLPLEPPLELFVWPEDSLSKEGKPEADRLVPAPRVPQPPKGCGVYPEAPEYVLNVELDHSYRRGWRYAAPFLLDTKHIQKENMLHIQMPPNVTPTRFNLTTRSFVADPIPGMVRLPLGIPLVHHVAGDPKRAVTAVCAHSLSTLMEYDEGPKVLELVPRLMELTWGREKTDSDPGAPGIFALPGMQHNLRSKNVDASKRVPGDGSFNLASTHGEGEGYGHFSPAVQTNTPQAAATIKEVLKILHQLYRLIMPLCISRFEWDMMELHGYENNVVAFGGLKPGPTSVQHNSSSSANVFDLDLPETENIPSPAPAQSPAESHPPPAEHRFIDLEDHLISVLKRSGNLNTAIGPQGSPHGDFKDDALWFTLFVLMFRLPKGSDMGAFLWMRGAIYLRETDEYILFASFKAQDIHSGSAPTYVQQLKDAMEETVKLFKMFGSQVRCGYVLYPSMAATTHSTQILYTPSLRFLLTPADPRANKRHYYTSHGNTVLGDEHSRANRLAREGVLALKNFFSQSALNFKLNIDALLDHTTYTDENGVIQKVDCAPIDIDDDETYEMLSLYRRYFFWWLQVISDYSLGVTKPAFKERQQSVKDTLAGLRHQVSQPIPTERKLVIRPRLLKLPSDSPVIVQVVGRKLQGSEAIWTLILKGSPAEVEVSQSSAKWLAAPLNGQKCLQYYLKYGNSPPPVKDAEQPSRVGEPDTVPEPLLEPVKSHLQSDEHAAQGQPAPDFVHAESDPSRPLVSAAQPTDVASNMNPGSSTDVSSRPIASVAQPTDRALAPAALNAASNVNADSPSTGDSPIREKRKSHPRSNVDSQAPHRKQKRPRRKTPVLSDSEEDELPSEPKSKRQRLGGKDLFLSDSEEEEEPEPEFEVDKIVAFRQQNGQRQWRVRWKGYGADDDLWLGAEDLERARELLDTFNLENGVLDPQPLDLTADTPEPPSSDDEYELPALNSNGKRLRRFTKELDRDIVASGGGQSRRSE